MGRLSADEWERRALQAEAAWGDMKLGLEGGQGTLGEPEMGMERMVGLVHTCPDLGASVPTTPCKLENPLLAHRLEKVTENTYNPAVYARREGLDEAEAVLAHDQSKFGALNLVMALLTRPRSMHMTPTITVVLSVLCFFTTYHADCGIGCATCV